MEVICDKEICTGCGLCAAKCVKQCIKMVAIGRLGHLHPQINQEQCVDCGLCKKVCPSVNVPILNVPITAYAALAKDKNEHNSSTSGGAASVFSRYIIENGGVVYGCAVVTDDDVIDVRHIRVDNMVDLQQLKGSKYVQSRITEIIPQLKEDVKSGKKVLFIGTPCQCAAINNNYRTSPNNLYIVDLICHGVPSLNILKRHIKNVIPNKHISNISFREGNVLRLYIETTDNTVYSKSTVEDRFNEFYYDAFVDGATFRDSCYSCHYAKSDRCSDITIGDFWGLNKDADNYLPNHANGISVLLPITEKGMSLVKATMTSFYCVERDVDEAIKGNHQLQYPSSKGWRVKLFRHLANFIRIETAYKISIFDRIVRRSLSKMIQR